jgi:exopolysaccharide biosynthesis polyprenyl glycosylphosphotransferase
MYRGRLNFIKTSIAIIDIILTGISYYAAYYLRDLFFSDTYRKMAHFDRYIWVLWVTMSLWPVSLYIFGNYELKAKEKFFSILFKLFSSIALGIITIAAMFYFMKDNNFSRLFYGVFAVVNFILLSIERLIIKFIFYYENKRKKNHKRVLVVGTGSLAHQFTRYVNDNLNLMLDIVGYVTLGNKDNSSKNLNIIGNIENIADIIKKHVIDEVVLAMPKNAVNRIEPYVLDCEAMGITVNMIVDLFDFKVAKTKIGTIGELPVVTFHTVSLDEWQLFLKRLLDIAGGLVGIIITAIVFIFVAPAILIESPGPIFFSQKRVGKNGRIFKCYKFRSMYMDAEERKKELMAKNEMNGAIFKIKDDPRITKVGKFIRATSIDELPQFWNVLKGDMSLVGTRPPTLDEVERYKHYHWRRLSIKPGITGMWQVSGRNAINDFEEIVKLDTAYIDNWSIWLDIKLIFKTVGVVLLRKGGAY